jgi:hypothetical protein
VFARPADDHGYETLLLRVRHQVLIAQNTDLAEGDELLIAVGAAARWKTL